jgi:hypothetical protein
MIGKSSVEGIGPFKFQVDLPRDTRLGNRLADSDHDQIRNLDRAKICERGGKIEGKRGSKKERDY